MRRFTHFLTGTALLAVFTTSTTLGQTQLLSNTGFETVVGNVPVDWTITGDAVSATDGTFGSPAHSGARMLHASTNWGFKEPFAEQTIAVAPGVYDLELSFYTWIRDDGAFPSSASGEILVDGEVVAAAGRTELGFVPANDSAAYTQMLATWKGTVTAEITIRFHLIADGPGGSGWGIVNIDDVALWSRNCGTQHEVLDVSPRVFNQPVADDTITIIGTNLNNVTGVRLFRSPFDRQTGEIEEITGTLGPVGDGTSRTVDLSSAGADAGFYDLIVEQTGCNARVIHSAIQVRNPAELPNLLVNANFLAAENAGNAIIWFGDYLDDRAPAPSPVVLNGHKAWGNAVGEAGNTEETVFWQDVPVSVGDVVEATGSIACEAVGPAPSTCDITVNLWSMTSPSPTLIDTFSIDETTPSNRVPADGWVNFTVSGASTAPSVSIEVIATLFAADWDSPVSASADAFSLTASPACDTQHRVWFAWPGEGLHNVDPTVTIRGGTQLDQVTAVSLVFVDSPEPGDEPEVILPGTIDTQTPTELTVTFPVATNAGQEGLYNLVIEQPGCMNPNLEITRVYRSGQGVLFQKNVPPSFVDQFEVICANPTSLAAVSPEILLTEEGNVDLAIVGLAVDELDTVTLVHEDGEITIPGTDLGMVGSDLVATFDLSGAPCGFYELQATRPDGCNDPESLPEAFRYVKPGCNVLLNGDFEEEGPKGTDATPVARWSTAVGHTASAVKYNGSFFTTTGGFDGTDNRGSTDWGGAGSTARVIQSQPAIPGVDATLTGAIYVGDLGTIAHDHQVLLRDGDADGTIIDEFIITPDSVPGQTPWTTFELTGRVSSSMVTVEWGHQPTGDGGAATHVDELVLVYTALPCNDPFADADGDGDVDGMDFAIFQLCLTGSQSGHPPIPSDPAYCQCFDRDLDQDIDQSDFIQFANCVTGPDVLHALNPNPLCSDQP